METRTAQLPMQIECKPMQNELGEERFVIELPVEAFQTTEIMPLDQKVIQAEQAYLENSSTIIGEVAIFTGQVIAWVFSKSLHLTFVLVRVVLGIVCTAFGHVLVGLGQYAFGLMTRSPQQGPVHSPEMSQPSKGKPINIVTINNINVKS